MKRAVLFVAILSTLIASYSLLVRASLPQVPSNAWSATGDMALGRAGASAVRLADGRVLVSGGTNEGGVTASVERYSPTAGGFLATPSMENARANHTSTMLEDGRVLVVGGIGADGHAMASAELYDPSANAWTPAAPMNHARSGHTATLTSGGRVLVAGGDDTGVADATLEVFDPISATFGPLDATLTAPRTGHAAASLADGRVLIVGGFDGTTALASVDVYDPRTDLVSAGPSLTVARAGHSATTLLDGTVLIAGGASDSSELASAEIFDPSTDSFTATANTLSAARQRHAAFLLPHNNNVLIVGGTSGGNAVATAELFTPWEGNVGTFCATAVCGSGYAGPSAPSAARAWATGAALSFPASETIRTGPTDGLLLIAGGSANSSAASPTRSAELYGFATVTTDKEDYAPGTTVTIRGSGWQPGEWVALLLKEYPAYDEHQLVDVQADENGNIVSTEFVPDMHDIGIRFYLTAFGSISQAQTTFTDARTINSVTLNGGSSVTVLPNSSITAAVNVTTDGSGSNARWRSSGWRVSTTPPASPSSGVTCAEHTNHDGTGTSTESFTITAPSSPGTYNGYFYAYNDDCSGFGQPSALYTLPNSVIVDGTPPTVLSINRASTSPTNALSVSWTVTFSESVTGVAAADFALAASGVSGAAIASVTGSGATYTVTASTGSGDGTLGLNLVDDDSVADVAGNKLGGTGAGNGNFTGQVYTVDRTAPAVSSINRAAASPTNAASVNWTVSFSKNVTGVDAADFALAAAGISGSSITGVTGSNNIYTVTASTGSGDGTLGLNLVDNDSIVDGAGNKLGGSGAGNGNFTGQVYAVDKTPPSVVSIARAIASPTNAASVSWTVTLSEDVTGVDVGDFSLASVGLGGTAAIGTVTAVNGHTYTVAASTGTGTGTLGLNLTDDDTIVDAAGNKVGGTGVGNGNFAGQTYSVDRTLTPQVTIANRSYDGTIAATITGHTFTSSLTVTENVSIVGGNATFDSKNAGTGKTVTATGLGLAGTDAAKYVLSSTTATTTADITRRTLTVTASGVNKVYDGTTSATVTLATDKIDGDTVSAAFTSAMFADKHVGTAKPISVTGISISGVDGANYQLTDTTASATGNITPRDLTVSATGVNKVYDATAAATVTLNSDRIAGDAVTAAFTSATFGDKHVGTAKAISVAGISIGGADAGDYHLTNTTASASADITPRDLTVTATGVNKVYDATTNATVTLETNKVNGDAVTAAFTSATFGDKHVGTAKAISVAGISISGADAGDYHLTNTTATATADITARDLTVTATGVNRVYNGTTSATVTLVTDKIGGDDVSASFTSASFADKHVGTAKSVSITGISISGADAGDYHLTNATASTTADITPRDLAVTATGVNKVYNGTTSAVVTLSTDKIGGDDVSASSTSATFADKQVGTAKAVSVTGISISGGDAGNYHLTNSTASTAADITPRNLTVTATGVNKVYDGTTGAAVTLATDRIGGDDVLASSTSATFADKQVGTAKTVSVTGISISGGDASNYHLTNTTATATADITARDLTVTATGVNRVYNGTTSATVTLATDKIGGDDASASFTSATFTDKQVGTAKTVNVTGVSISGADASNYHLTNTTATATADITLRDLTVTATGVNKVYNGATSATVTLSTDKIGGDDVSASSTSASFADKQIGTAKTVSVTSISISGGDASNYHLTNTTASAMADITPRDLTVTATGVNKVYDGTTSAAVTLTTDKIGGDDVSASSTSAGFADKQVGTTKTVSVTGISISGGDAGNYHLTSTTATTTADITAKPASVTPNEASKTYGTADPGFSGSLVGFVAGDGVTASFSRTTGEAVAGSPYTISGVLSPAGVLGNYTITYNTASFRIDKAVASVTPAAANKVYGAADPVFTGTLSGFQAGDSVTAIYSRTAGETVGGYVISAALSPASVLGNYDITSNTAAFDISKKPASVTPTAANKVYGAADPTLTGTLSGFLVADGVTASYTRTAGEAVGAYLISAVLSPASVLGNYDITSSTAAFGINRKTASVTPDAASKTYGAADPVLTGSLEGFIAGDSVAATYSRTTGETVGAYVISAVLSPASVLENYDITSNTAAFDINKRTASVTANAANKTYGTADPALSGTLSGFLPADSVSAAYSRTTGETVAGNPYTISAVLGPAGVLENYAITYHTADFTIAARALTVTAAGTSRVYDGTTDATVTLSDDRVGGDVLNIGYTSASFTNKNVGTAKTVNVSGISVTGTAAGNYTFNTTASASADITARPITVAAIASSKIYDATTSSGVPALSLGMLMSGDTLSFAQTYDNKNVGTAKTLTPAGVVSDGNGGSNYSVTLATSTAGIITARSLTVTATAIDKVYDGTTTATVTLSDNRVHDDVLTESYASANFSNKNVATNKMVTVSGIAISGTDAGNYALSSTTASPMASITKRPLTVTAVTDSKIYDGTVASDKVPLISGGTSLAAGDTASLAETFDTKDVGTGKHMKPAVVVSDGNAGENYAVALVENPTGVIGAWSLKGFYQPVTMSPGAIVYNTIKGGSTVPLKFNIYAGVGGAEQTNTSAVLSFVLQLISCTQGIDDPVEEFITTGGTALRYDSTAGQFIQNWQSPKATGKCYAVTMTAQDSSTVTAYFKTK